MKSNKVFMIAEAGVNHNGSIEKVLKLIDIVKFFFYYNSSLNNRLYYSLIKFTDGVIGNSSSDICEVLSFNKGSINIGTRQDGRPRSKSIIDIKYDIDQFKSVLQKIMSTKFKQSLNKNINPYGNNKSSKLIFRKIKQFLKKD